MKLHIKQMDWRFYTIKNLLVKYRYDIILVIVVSAIAIGALLFFALTKSTDDLLASIYVRDTLIQEVNLSKETTERHFDIQGTNGTLTISVVHNAIAVVESNCPHQDCVNEGYVTETNHPIICAYNGVYIIVTSLNSVNDIEVGR